MLQPHCGNRINLTALRNRIDLNDSFAAIQFDRRNAPEIRRFKGKPAQSYIPCSADYVGSHQMHTAHFTGRLVPNMTTCFIGRIYQVTSTKVTPECLKPSIKGSEYVPVNNWHFWRILGEKKSKNSPNLAKRHRPLLFPRRITVPNQCPRL